ncbi:hypothetical protein NE579_17080, partial [Intestinimonas massiliensis]
SRAARSTLRSMMVCCNLAAVLEQADLGRSIHRPACVVAEGSTFYKGYLFRQKLERLCHTYITEELGHGVPHLALLDDKILHKNVVLRLFQLLDHAR